MATVKIEHHLTEETEINRDVQQDSNLSPLIFNLYSKEIFNEAIVDCTVKIIDIVKYADDTLSIANTNKELQLVMNQITNACTKYGLKLKQKQST